MKLQIQRHDLEHGVQTASKAVATKGPLPILSHIRLTAIDDRLELAATDLEMCIDSSVQATVLEPGAVTAPGRLLSDVVAVLEDSEVRMEFKGHMLYLTTSRSEFEINTLSADEFPILPAPEAAASIVVPQGLLRQMLRGVLFAVASPDETRAMLTGVLVQVEDGQLTMTATDGRRLARVRKSFDGSASLSNYKGNIAAKALNDLVRLLGDGTEPVEIIPAQGQVFFRFGRTVLTAKLIEEGRFPDCDAIIPKTSQRTVHVHRDTLSKAVRAGMIMAKEADSPSLVKLEISSNEICIRSNTPDRGRAIHRVPVSLQGEPITIAFNGTFVQDALANMVGEEVVFKLNDPLSMALLQPVGSEDYLYLVMPVRVKETFSV
jgi:DNA polymerase III subunit beta